jgi:hypothetical protein
MKDAYIIYILSGFAAFVTLLSLMLSIKILKMRKKIKTILMAYSKIESMMSLKEDHKIDNNVHKESFIKFLSDSRDWAYEYIETVQAGITKFVNDVDADISYFDEYGETLSMGRPDFAAMKNISIAYKDLKKMLPESDSDGR